MKGSKREVNRQAHPEVSGKVGASTFTSHLSEDFKLIILKLWYVKDF